jgi:hypothetical protein
MFRRWSGSIGSLLLCTCLTACPGSDNKTPDPDGNGDPDGGKVYDGDAGIAAGSGGSSGSSNGGSGGSKANTGGSGNDWSPAKDVKPAECLPDPTAFTPCGGDVTGKWRIASICFPSGIEELRELLQCEAIEQDFDWEYRMLVEFKSSGNFSVALKSDAVQKVTVPKTCLESDSDCTELGSDDTDASDGETITITSTVEACAIEAQIHQADSAAGTWEVNGSKLTMTDPDGPDVSDYCINGNTLTVKSTNDVTGEVNWGVFERL